jgi:O-antigen/teichoic acid export membrane protein
LRLARALSRHAFVYGAGITLQRAVGFLMLPLYTHRLTKADYGLMALIDSAVGLVALLVGLNLSEALIRIYNEEESEPGRRLTVATAVLTNALLAGFVALVLSLFAPTIGPELIGAPCPPHLVVLALTTMALDCAATPSFTYLRLLDRSGMFVGVSLARLVIAVTLNVVWLGFFHGGITAYFASGAIASGAQCLGICAWTFGRVPLRIGRAALVRLLKFSLPLVPASVCSLVLHQASRQVLGRAGALEALGVFGVAYQLGNIVSNGIVQPFSLVWSTKIYEVIREPDGNRSVARVFLWFALVLTWGAVGLSLLGRPLLESGFVGAGFGLAARSVPLVALAYVLFGLGFIVHFGVFIAKRTEKSLYAAAIAAVVSIAANILGLLVVRPEDLDLVPAVSGVFSFLVLAVLRYKYAQELYPFPYDWRRAGALVLLGAGLVVVAELGPSGLGPELALRIPLALVFPVLAVAFVIPLEERREALELARPLLLRARNALAPVG